MTDLDRAILDSMRLFASGKGNARPRDWIVERIEAWKPQVFRTNDHDREFRRAVHALVERGYPLVTTPRLGYWMAETPEEIEEGIRSLVAPYRESMRRVNGLRRAQREQFKRGKLELL